MFSVLTAIPSMVLEFLLSSLINPHFWAGIVLGAALAPLWVKLWAAAKAFIIKKDPGAATVITDVTNVTNQVVADVTPVVTDVVNKVTAKK